MSCGCSNVASTRSACQRRSHVLLERNFCSKRHVKKPPRCSITCMCIYIYIYIFMFIYLNIHKYDSNTFSWLIPSTILCGANPPPLVPLCPPLSKEPIEYARAVAHPHDTRLGCQPIQPLCFRIKAYGDPNMAKIIGTTQVDSKSKRSVNLSNIHNGSNNYWPKHGSQWM